MLRGQLPQAREDALLQGIALYFQVAEDGVDKDAEGLTLIGSHLSLPMCSGQNRLLQYAIAQIGVY